MKPTPRVNKKEVRKDIKHLTKFLAEYSKFRKSIKNNYYENEAEIDDGMLEFYNVKLLNLKRQLTCKHERTERVDHESYHNGDIRTEIKCTDCDFIIQYGI